MPDAVHLFILPGILMLLHDLVQIIVHRRTGRNAGLRMAVHGKFIEIIAGNLLSHKNPLLLHLFQNLPGFHIDALIIGIHVIGKPGFRSVDAQKGKRLLLHLSLRFLSVVNIIWQRSHPRCGLCGGAHAVKRFYLSHFYSPPSHFYSTKNTGAAA